MSKLRNTFLSFRCHHQCRCHYIFDFLKCTTSFPIVYTYIFPFSSFRGFPHFDLWQFCALKWLSQKTPSVDRPVAVPPFQNNSNITNVLFRYFVLLVVGVIRTALANMDRETREMYSIIIQAKDMAGSVGGLSGSTTVNITLTDVNDNPPRFPQSMWCFTLFKPVWASHVEK